MNNEALEILEKRNVDNREVIIVNKKNMVFPFGFMTNTLYDLFISYFASGRMMETM